MEAIIWSLSTVPQGPVLASVSHATLPPASLGSRFSFSLFEGQVRWIMEKWGYSPGAVGVECRKFLGEQWRFLGWTSHRWSGVACWREDGRSSTACASCSALCSGDGCLRSPGTELQRCWAVFWCWPSSPPLRLFLVVPYRYPRSPFLFPSPTPDAAPSPHLPVLLGGAGAASLALHLVSFI